MVRASACAPESAILLSRTLMCASPVQPSSPCARHRAPSSVMLFASMSTYANALQASSPVASIFRPVSPRCERAKSRCTRVSARAGMAAVRPERNASANSGAMGGEHRLWQHRAQS
eukprot:3493021-Rhodomonas_salina.5